MDRISLPSTIIAEGIAATGGVGSRVHTRGALAFRHLDPVRPVLPAIRPTRGRGADVIRGPRLPVPLMSLIIPIPPVINQGLFNPLPSLQQLRYPVRLKPVPA